MLGALLLLTIAAAQAEETAATLPRIVPRCEVGSAGDDIVVCGRRDRNERYRLPIRPDGFDPSGPVDSVSRERHRLIQEGKSGASSCSNVGPGGSSGCFARDVERRCQQDPCGIAF